MASRLKKLLSFKSDNSSSDIVNNIETRTNALIKAASPDQYYKRKILDVHIETLYKIETFNFQTAYSIKTHEEIIHLQSLTNCVSF